MPGDDRWRPGWSRDIWDDYRAASAPVEEDDEHTPSGRHHCGVGGKPGPGHSEYRRCDCGQWYLWDYSLWRPVSRPSRRWLRTHGLGSDAGDFWDFGAGDPHGGSVFGEFRPGRHWLRRLLRILRLR